MLTEDQLKAILADLEADNIERTISVSDTDKFAQAICAYANDLPNNRRSGYLLVGVKDNGALSGLTVTD
jgi:ATP-dependent DNA helicase RecG